MKKAFTLIELILVLVIVGIIASIGSDIVFKAYENYILSKEISAATYKTDVALEQIAKRLEHRIPFSGVAIKDETHSNDIISLTSDTNMSLKYQILAWIGKAYEARRGSWNGYINKPGWSGFIDLKDSNETKLFTKGDNLIQATNIIFDLSNGDVNLSKDYNGGIIFPTIPYNVDIVTAYGWKMPQGENPTHIFPVNVTGMNEFTFYPYGPKRDRIYEHYYLAWSAYAVVPEDNGDGTYTVRLYYNFRPWKGETYQDGDSSVLIDKATIFNFRRDGKAIELRLCAHSDLNTSEIEANICGKKVVF
ncbi:MULTISPECIES: type IV pilin protein [unclassified Nitratiruptor]|uniref:type IV pilin protein n=1 Tax=unclassified Nitratiruptor TaxID=2624044 RepID=UPI001914DB30|nr:MULTISPECIES: prepilin-type N-terminal cleavage/methylation domain-containing protein [unclassified Nitratiruptor]BCD60661.1 hypothetical protein NitYY0810_C1437 [Nitratiruptor sp. YY08-10]BCD64592.1 hypothetical protein NitYY0814_C1444 [Nitratiruptor sp. YY08-14]